MDRSTREIVYCHQCENEWYKDEHDLKCPRCESEFTEVIEAGHDPRDSGATDLDPFLNHNPWDAPDPDEDDIDNLTGATRGENMGSRRFPFNSREPGATNNGPNDPPTYTSLFSDFTSMVHQIVGDSRSGIHPHDFHRDVSPPPGFPAGGIFGHGGDSGSAGAGGGGGGMFGFPPEHFRPSSAPGNRTVRSSNGPGGARIAVSYSSGPMRGGGFQSTFVSGNAGSGQPLEGSDIHEWVDPFEEELLGQLFGGLPGANAPPGARGGGGLGEVLSRLMMGQLHGQNAGDFVHTDRGMEDIISQLMEQHSRSNAPAPASEEAIRSLPQRPADKKLFDGESTGSCPVCMDEVEVGENVQVLPCNHWFHPQCSEAWLREHDTCPICRSGITPKDGDRNQARQPEQEPLHNEDPVQVRERQELQRRESYQQQQSSPSFGRHHSGTQQPQSPQSPSERHNNLFRQTSGGPQLSPQLPRRTSSPPSSRTRGSGGSGGSGSGTRDGDDQSLRSRVSNWFTGNGSQNQRRKS